MAKITEFYMVGDKAFTHSEAAVKEVYKTNTEAVHIQLLGGRYLVKGGYDPTFDAYTDRQLDELFELTQEEQERELTAGEKERYIQRLTHLQADNVPITFPVEW